MSDDRKEDFLNGIDELVPILGQLGFSLTGRLRKASAHFVTFRKGKISTEFLYGPSEWNPEMIIRTPRGKFGFEDLMAIPEVSAWVSKNQYKQPSGRSIKNELVWYVDLLKISLPYLK